MQNLKYHRHRLQSTDILHASAKISNHRINFYA